MFAELADHSGGLSHLIRQLCHLFRQPAWLFAELSDHSGGLARSIDQLCHLLRQLSGLLAGLSHHSGGLAGTSGGLAGMPGELARQIAGCVYLVNKFAKGSEKMVRKMPLLTRRNEGLPGVLLAFRLYFAELASAVG
ncbi:hypothetical protein HNQ91_005823 [Filimonas zeae]|uniref:Uncharacterized protein n=1 Tax=Filimonas zeae TaxID=1737353 RepID=A0A917J3Q0_9BACT|nr:hypothetical protein [Filimonas zeae]MDR6342738.1 hypothetical protein [Filimonas zeae]GGH82510.1 hypothetical protein GCM10011379_56510 [Filimonas zeae]